MKALKCQECQSSDVKLEGQPIRESGKWLFPKRCQKCSFLWTDAVRPVAAEPAIESADESGKQASASAQGAPAENAAAPAGGSQPPVEKILTAADGFDESELKVGDMVIFADRDGQQKRLAIVSTAKKTVLGDVDGKPDQRIRRDEILGVVVRE